MSRAADRRRARAALLLLVSLSLACRKRAAPPVPADPPWEFVPQSAAFELPFGGETSADFRLTGVGATAATLTVVSGGDPDLRVETLPGGPGVAAGLRLHASGRKVGARTGTLLVAAGPSAPRQVPLLFALRVRGTLHIVPTNPVLDLGVPGAPATVLDVSSPRADFAVSAVEISRGPFAATWQRAPDGGAAFRITVTARGETLAKGARGAVGTLVIVSNDGAEPRKEIPLFAFGAADR